MIKTVHRNMVASDVLLFLLPDMAHGDSVLLHCRTLANIVCYCE